LQFGAIDQCGVSGRFRPRTLDHACDLRVAVITGAGKAFSAGGDYHRASHMLSEMSDLVYNIINCDKPIVSAINGAAVGAGAVAALLADVAIAAEDAKIGDGHVKLFGPDVVEGYTALREQRPPGFPSAQSGR